VYYPITCGFVVKNTRKKSRRFSPLRAEAAKFSLHNRKNDVVWMAGTSALVGQNIKPMNLVLLLGVGFVTGYLTI
jgi:hypothetical protein